MKASATGEYWPFFLAPNLDRPGEFLSVVEAEAHDEMRHFRPRPIDQEEIERLELGKVVGALAPSFGEVIVGAPVEVAHVGKRQNVAVQRSSRLTRDIGGPIAVSRRLDRVPPDHDSAESEPEDQQRGPTTAREDRGDGRNRDQCEGARGGDLRPFRRREPEP